MQNTEATCTWELCFEAEEKEKYIKWSVGGKRQNKFLHFFEFEMNRKRTLWEFVLEFLFFFIKPERINLFFSIPKPSSSVSLTLSLPLLLKTRIHLFPCKLCGIFSWWNIISIISEAARAWTKVQGWKNKNKIYNSNSRYQRNKKFTFYNANRRKVLKKENPLFLPHRRSQPSYS